MNTNMEEERRRRPVEPETVTVELMIEAMRAIQHIDRLEELQREIGPELEDGRNGPAREASVTLGELAKSMRRILLDPRRFICAMDQAARRPDWWAANYIHFFNPEMSHKDIAAHLKINSNSVRDYIQTVEIPANCYDNLPPIDEP